MSPAVAIATFLADRAVARVGVTSGWAVFVGREMEKPDEAVTIYDTGGPGPDTDQLDVYRPTVQIRVRSKDYLSGYGKHEEIRVLLRDNHAAVNPKFRQVVAVSDILPIGRDDGDRYLFTMNYTVLVFE